MLGLSRRWIQKRRVYGDRCSIGSLQHNASPSSLCLAGRIPLFPRCAPAPDLVSGVIPYLLEGHYTFAFKSMRAMTVAEMFVFIIAARSLLVWGYAGWAKQRGLFSVRMSLTRPDAAWCLAAAFVAIATAVIQSHFSGEPHHFTWVAFTRYWGVLPGIGDTILQYAYYVTEGFAIVWMVDAFQNAGEFAFPRLRFPWGAVGLMVTWGAGHYFSIGEKLKHVQRENVVRVWALPRHNHQHEDDYSQDR